MNEPTVSLKSRILIVDDNPAIHDDIRRILGRQQVHAGLAEAKNLLFGTESASSDQLEFEIESAYQGQEGLQKVEEAEKSGRPFAMAFIDIRMPPGWDGVETISRIWTAYPDLQMVICTAYSDYSWDEMIRRIGKSDSLLILKKPFDNIEVLQLAHALTEKWRLSIEVRIRLQNLDLLVNERTTDLQSTNEKLRKEIEERMVLQNALRLSEERFSKAFKASPIPLAIRSLREEKYVDANEGFQLLTGYSRDELLGRVQAELNIWNDPRENTAMLQTLKDQMFVRNMPCQLRVKDKQLRHVLWSAELFDLEGEPFILCIAQDITEQLTLENQLRQAQKMEAVGQLAAGVAHDFNNLLTIVQGHASLLLYDSSPESKEHSSLETIFAATERGAKLIRQLLAFSRKQFIHIQPVTPQEILSSLSEMLPRLLRENIKVTFNAPPSDVRINADPGMLEQVLMNCAVNSRDAMPDGGQLTLSADVVEIEPSAVNRNRDARAGQFVRLSVADTGCGIPPENLAKVFEPFFTTKPVGQGTGLGLAAVYGIAKQHGGWVELESQIGQGTTLHIFIPTCPPASEKDAPSPALGALPRRRTEPSNGNPKPDEAMAVRS